MLILFLFHFRHCLHLFGHNCHRANLMDVVQFKDEFNVELVGGTNNKSVPYSVSRSFIGITTHCTLGVSI